MRRRIYRTVYWRRILIFIALLSVVACGAILYFVYFKSTGGFLRIDSMEYHMVVVSRHNSKAQADAQSVILRQSGGAGYVLAKEDAFHLAASVYGSRRDAEAVAARIHDAEIHTLNVPTLKIPLSSGDGQLKEYAAYFSYPRELFETLYRLSTQFDEGTVTESYAVLTVCSFRSRVYENRQKLQTFADYPQYADVDAMYATLYGLFLDTEGYRYASAFAPNLRYLLCGIADADIKCRLDIKRQL